MTSEMKIKMLIKYENKQKLTYKHFCKIKKFSDDKDALVRSMVADLLVNFSYEEAKKILLKLARDKKSMVRIDAYDSLAVFAFEDVEIFLKKAILHEKNEMACAYAIMSWGDISGALGGDMQKRKFFVNKIKMLERIKNSERCMLSCYYVEYILGRRERIKKIMFYLNSENYHIRCSTINILWSLLDIDNQEIIKKSLIELTNTEKIYAVKENAVNLLEFINNG